jgi:hypothetical protein
MVIFTAIVAVVSYLDGLYLIRYIGATGWAACLYPLIPDGLILICSLGRRAGWSMAGVVLGVLLTLLMNVGAGILHNWMYAVADGVVPVVFFVALENVRHAPERGRGGGVSPVVPAAFTDAGTGDTAGTRSREAIFLELAQAGTRKEVGQFLGMSPSQVQRRVDAARKAFQAVPEEAAPASTEAYWDGSFEAELATSANGSGTHG